MTVAVTRPRIMATLDLITQRISGNEPPPTNYEIAIHIGMGQQRFQPYDRSKGLRTKKPEAGTVMVRALEMLGLIEVERIGRRKRVIRLVEKVSG